MKAIQDIKTATYCEAETKAEEALRLQVKRLKKKNSELNGALQEARCVSRRLLQVVYEYGVISENQSIFSLFKEVRDFSSY